MKIALLCGSDSSIMGLFFYVFHSMCMFLSASVEIARANGVIVGT
jgi:hypothetical protein